MGKGNLTLTPLLFTLAVILCLPGEALALQVHGEPDARWASANGLSPVKARICLMLDLIDDDLAAEDEDSLVDD